MNVQEYLKEQFVPYEVIQHEPTFDAQHLAEAVHESGYHVGKTVLLKIGDDSTHAIAIVPATHTINLEKAKRALETDHLELASEDEIGEHLSGCESGVVPPFGSCFGMKTIMDEALTGAEEIVFEGTTHSEAIKMKFSDFDQLEHPAVVSIAEPVFESSRK